MYIVYEPGDFVKLRRTYEYEDLNDWGFDDFGTLNALREAAANGYETEIRGMETDGYYNITVYFPDDTQRLFNAICVYHLTPASDDHETLALLDVGEAANR